MPLNQTIDVERTAAKLSGNWQPLKRRKLDKNLDSIFL